MTSAITYTGLDLYSFRFAARMNSQDSQSHDMLRSYNAPNLVARTKRSVGLAHAMVNGNNHRSDRPLSTEEFRGRHPNPSQDFWSPPELTNLSGTGATGVGLTLPDGSLITSARIPHHVKTTWIQPPRSQQYGLHVARSFDLGKTWKSERFFQQDPSGLEFDNYYNAMNGQFIQLEDRHWIYAFGHFDVERKLHRMLAFDLSWD